MPFIPSGGCNTQGINGTTMTSSGTIQSLVALGDMDLALKAKAGVTLWRFRYYRITNFQLESLAQPFNTTVAFGGTADIKLQRMGDLIYFMYIIFHLPGIYGCKNGTGNECGDTGGCGCDSSGNCIDNVGVGFPHPNRLDGSQCVKCTSPCGDSTNSYTNDAWFARNYGLCERPTAANNSCEQLNRARGDKPWVHWANAIGQLLVRQACLVIGNHETDTLYSDYLYMWEELSGKAGKRLMEMIGKYRTRQALVRASARDQILYVPLPFWFTQSSGNALALCSLQFHGVGLRVQFEDLQNCIVRSGGDVIVRKTRDGSAITHNDLEAYIDTTYVYLDIHERNQFSDATFEQLIVQVQRHCEVRMESRIRMSVSFNHPVIELIWAVRRVCNEHANNHFNYCGLHGFDPIHHVSLKLNNLCRFAGREGRYYRLVQPYQFHSHLPEACVYCYSFALFPEEPQPSGSANFSRIDNVEFIIDLQDGLGMEEVSVLLFARNWNILKYVDGLAGVAYNA